MHFNSDATIREMRKAQREAEMREGRRRTLLNMAEGLVDQLMSELQLSTDVRVNIVTGVETDFRGWRVELSSERFPDVVLSEPIIDFPSDHMKAQLFLLGANRKSE